MVHFLLFACSPAKADWFDAHWQYRRTLEVNWDSANGDGRELAMAEFYTAGHAAADGSDVRVTNADNQVIPSHVLGVGPGDTIRVVFALSPGQSNYNVYFGNPAPPPPSAGTEDVQYRCGLLLDMRQLPGGRYNTIDNLLSAWSAASKTIGKTLVDEPFYGVDPFGDYSRTISKLSGSFVVPVDGDYMFAGAAEGRAAILIDNLPELYIPGMSHDIRNNVKVHLARGEHQFELYYASQGNTTLISVGWRRPDMDKVDVMPRTAFGVFGHARAGPLQERDATLVADFDAEYGGEFFVGNNYSHRYLFTAYPPPGADNAQFEWDFGDGVTAKGADLEHVFVTAGTYPVRLTIHVGANSDTQTTRLAVDRDWPNLDHASEDPPFMQARIVAQYDVSRVPEPWLSWMVQIEQQVQLTEAPMAAAVQMTKIKRHERPAATLEILRGIAGDLEAGHHVDQAVKLWEGAAVDSDLQPTAASEAADLLIWRQADFPGALAVTEPLADSFDPIGQQARAESLIFSGRADEGKKILDVLQGEQAQSPLRLAALSGALARTIEFRLDQRDWQNGEVDWKTWQASCPSVFLEGYSVELRTRLMEEAGYAPAAAKVAEAFALAVPDSPYSPQLLDRASKLLAKSDPSKSQLLRDELKSRYPEDPLSQD